MDFGSASASCEGISDLLCYVTLVGLTSGAPTSVTTNDIAESFAGTISAQK